MLEAAEVSRRECWPAASHCCNNRAWPKLGGRAPGRGKLKWCGGDVEEALDDVEDDGDSRGDTGPGLLVSRCRLRGEFW